jgi:hypothetical protein
MNARTTCHVAAKALLGLALTSGVTLPAGFASIPSVVAAQTAKVTAIRSISVTTNGPALIVVIEGNGPLPLPTTGVVDGPPRIFLDFPGIALTASKITSSSDTRLHRIRAGVNSATPLVTRIVLDLVAPQPFVVERGPNRVSVIVGAPAGMAPPAAAIPRTPWPVATSSPSSRVPAAPVSGPRYPTNPIRPPAVPVSATGPLSSPPPAPPPSPAPSSPAGYPPAIPPVPNLPGPIDDSAPRASAPARPPLRSPVAATAPPISDTPAEKPAAKVTVPPVPPARSSSPSSLPVPPAKDLDRYRRQVSPALDRLRLQEPLLNSLDSAEAQPMDRVQLAVEEFERLRQELAGIKPPESLRSQHDMLIQSTTLALMATRLRVEAFRTSDPATLRNVASAAAGATLLLDRACADLGCPDSGR